MMDESHGACSSSGPPPSDNLTAMCAAHAPVSANGHFPVGTVFDDWRLTAFIGCGGNGEVYCAEHAALGTPAAVKVLMREDERAKMRFKREAKLLFDLKSDAFPHFFAYNEANGHPYLAMELLEPGELPTGDRAVARFLLKVCDAVAELHARGYIHRDIKPSNILWRRVEECSTGRNASPRRPSVLVPVLADLGLVKNVQPSNSQPLGLSNAPTTLGGLGTPGYGAPEQMERGEATVASDIHALGVLADRCFGGKPSRAWARIMEHATSSIPARRYPSVAALVRAIRWHRRKWHMFGLMAFLLALAVSSVVVYPLGKSQPDVQVEFPSGQLAAAKETQNKPFPGVMRLEGKTVVLHDPIILEAGKEYRVYGPGTLDADLSCPTTAVMRLKDCVLLNRTKILYPQNGILYRLEDGVYLNFINIPESLRTANRRPFGLYDGAFNEVRFGGPATLKELIKLRSDEREADIKANMK